MKLKHFLRTSPLPKLETRLLVQAVTGYTHAQLITRDEECLSENNEAVLRRLVARRQAGEPVAYLLGWREFYGRRFAVSPATLIPRPETEYLVEAAVARLPEGGSAWDLGTGSGAIAVTLALERPDARVYASDISREALAVAEGNARSLGANVVFACGSWFDAECLSEKKPFDLVISNPPYIERHDPHLAQGDLRFEPQNALTDFADGLSCIRTLAEGAPAHLKAGGWLLLEHGFDQGGSVRMLLQANGFTAVETLRDLAGLDRITVGRKPDG